MLYVRSVFSMPRGRKLWQSANASYLKLLGALKKPELKQSTFDFERVSSIIWKKVSFVYDLYINLLPCLLKNINYNGGIAYVWKVFFLFNITGSSTIIISFYNLRNIRNSCWKGDFVDFYQLKTTVFFGKCLWLFQIQQHTNQMTTHFIKIHPPIQNERVVERSKTTDVRNYSTENY